MKKRNKHVGSSLDELLKKEGILEEVRATAARRSITTTPSRTKGVIACESGITSAYSSTTSTPRSSVSKGSALSRRDDQGQ